MKNKITKFFVILLCLPTLLFCACSDNPSELPSINMQTYYSATAKTRLYNEDLTGSLNLTDLIADEPNMDTLAPYTQITLPGNLVWLYKMYIDCITFYVYTNEETSTEMIVSVAMSNLADENDRSNIAELKKEASFTPTKNGSTFCKIDVKKVIASATDANSDSIVFSLSNVNGIVADNTGNPSTFRWTIYGLKIYGESRSYSS